MCISFLVYLLVLAASGVEFLKEFFFTRLFVLSLLSNGILLCMGVW